MSSTRWLAVCGAFWSLAVTAGFAALARHEFTPGDCVAVRGTWPAEVAIARDSGRPTLLVFAHPRCPCTRATIGELERLAARIRERVEIVALFLDPETEADWCDTDAWRRAVAIPGVRAERDRNGAIGRAFGVRTSGHALLYDRDGRLAFEGGITSSRGHEGDNDGSRAIRDWVTAADERDVATRSTPVFGCGLGACASDEDGGGDR